MDLHTFNLDTILSLLSGLFGGTSLLGYFAYRKVNARLKDAEVKQKETEAQSGVFAMYEERLTHANQTIEGHNQTIAHQSETIATLNDALDSKTSRIRQLTDELYDSERKINDLNDKLIAKTEEVGKLEVIVTKLRSWRCEKNDCEHRIPPSKVIKGKTFEDDITTA